MNVHHFGPKLLTGAGSYRRPSTEIAPTIGVHLSVLAVTSLMRGCDLVAFVVPVQGR